MGSPFENGLANGFQDAVLSPVALQPRQGWVESGNAHLRKGIKINILEK